MSMPDDPEMAEFIKRGHLTALFLAIFAYPSFMLVDWLVRPESFVAAAAIRLFFSLFALFGFLLFRKIPARNHIPLVYLTVSLISICQLFVTFIVREITYLLASVMILFVVGSLIPMSLTHTAVINSVMFVVIYLIPFLILGLNPSTLVMGTYGLITGIVGSVLSGFTSVTMFRMRTREKASYDELRAKNQELLDLAEENRRQVEISRMALSELTGMVASLADAVEKIRQASSHLSSSAEEMRAGISESARANEEVSLSITKVDSVLQTIRKTITDFGRWEREEASLSRDKLLEVTSRMSETVSEIGKMSAVVTDMSRKTHILALNAGIETARSGAAGSFDVIAKRMREFSEETREKTGEILRLLRTLEEQSGALSNLMEVYAGQSRAAAESFTRTIDEFDSAAGQISIIRQRSEAVASLAEEQAKAISALAESAVELDRLVEDLRAIMIRLNEAENRIKDSI